MSHASPLPRIAIIGAGPGGLTLASILQRNGVPFTVYERDTGLNARNQGGSLDLHPRTGQAALRDAGIWDEFAKYARPESDTLKVVRQDGKVLWDDAVDAPPRSEGEAFEGRPEIDRGALQDVLVGAVDPKAIVYGKGLLSVEQGERPETWDLHFKDGSVDAGFGLVVGADGAWSKVRAVLTDVKPYYSGITGIECRASDVTGRHAWMSEYVGKGSLFSFGEGRSIQIQRQGGGAIRTYACLRKPESFLKDCGIDWERPDQARKEYCERYYNECGELLKRMILESDDVLVARALYMLPVGFRWDSKPGITLLGDAAHLMTPFAGVGVNAAMADAMQLAKAIIAVKDGADLSSSIEQYDQEMIVRGEMFARKTADNMEKHFSADGAEHLANRLRQHHGLPPTPPLLSKMAA